ncbi:hypothetical protein N9L26_01205 [Candidatus Pacebacteria bacterium]|nr:hypothetical protein [Candidatus Paceibacterota bacterium]
MEKTPQKIQSMPTGHSFEYNQIKPANKNESPDEDMAEIRELYDAELAARLRGEGIGSVQESYMIKLEAEKRRRENLSTE